MTSVTIQQKKEYTMGDLATYEKMHKYKTNETHLYITKSKYKIKYRIEEKYSYCTDESLITNISIEVALFINYFTLSFGLINVARTVWDCYY